MRNHSSKKPVQTHGDIPVVGIGYSAGGLEPVQEILAALPNNTGLAYVIVQHLKQDQQSHLQQILAKVSRMPVQTIKRRTALARDTVYVVPPGFNAALAGNYLHLTERQESAPSLGIDFFFSSLGLNRPCQAIGVLLSGSGSDGTLGLKAIKGEGGITIVQDPKSAKFAGMPRSAIASGVVDLILTPGEIPKELERLARHPYTHAVLAGKPLTLDATDSKDHSIFSQILDLLHFHTDVDFSKYKMSTVKRRIERQMMLRKIETVDRYSEYLRKNTDEIKALYEDLFIHVTDFFRDEEAYSALKEKVFPQILKNKAKDASIRIWVPGCASGEEVYSLAILLTEFLEESDQKRTVNIFAGDISEPAVSLARRGYYSDFQMRNVSPDRLERFFEKVKGGYKVRKNLRDLCIFSRHDVTSNPPIPNVDLISCRNVLIYFSADLQRRVFPVFHYALNDNGYLWLGRAESPDAKSKLFKTVDKTHKIFSKVGVGHLPPHRFSSTTYSSSPVESGNRSLPHLAHSPMSNADHLMLHRYSPPSVVINSHLEVVNFRGRTIPFLEPPAGGSHYDLLKMANPDLAGALRHCVQTARKTGAQCREEGVEFVFEGKRRKVSLDVSPLNLSAPERERLYLVVFEEGSNARNSGANTKRTKPVRLKKGDPTQIQNLIHSNNQIQRELEAAREYQQSLIEEYETAQEELTSSNEELRSTNEELQSTNEELHSANEELGTAKEELQAANEELLSINEELQRRNQELESAMRDLAASEQRFRLMIDGVRDYAIFMMDPEGRITSWNEGAKRLKGYTKEEIVGQSFTRFYSEADIQSGHPQKELQIARETGRYEEEGWRVRKDGSRYWANVLITCVLDQDGNHIGFSKVTRDLTERMQHEAALKRANEGLEAKVVARTAELQSALKSRDEFLSVASHELRTPLTSLKLETQMLKSGINAGTPEYRDPATLAETAEKLEQRVNRLQVLVDDMLDVSRIQSGTLALDVAETDLSDLIRNVVAAYSAETRGAGCAVRLKIQDGVRGLMDRSRIEQLVLNLLSNAVKYGAGKPIDIEVYAENENATVVVRDQGIGISPEDQARVFDRFERAVSASEISGLGLGLYISRQIVNLHQGTLMLKSELGAGSEFKVILPLHADLKTTKKDQKPYEF